MAFLKGNDGVCKVGTTTADQSVLHIQNWNIDEQADIVSGWGMGDTYSTKFTTIINWSGSLEVYIDPTDAGAALLTIGTVIQLELYPGGETTGLPYFSGEAIVSGTPRSGSKDNIPTVTFNFEGRGPLTPASVT